MWGKCQWGTEQVTLHRQVFSLCIKTSLHSNSLYQIQDWNILSVLLFKKNIILDCTIIIILTHRVKIVILSWGKWHLYLTIKRHQNNLHSWINWSHSTEMSKWSDLHLETCYTIWKFQIIHYIDPWLGWIMKHGFLNI